ncbi:Nephronectin [Myotis brandtii]|uniref:Nephronectin n=1 Tax=Myotis brandtii TaxID=109478 RepID=S7N6A5_MYOBR|nr:Nephronectin [Myotis brandtii]
MFASRESTTQPEAGLKAGERSSGGRSIFRLCGSAKDVRLPAFYVLRQRIARIRCQLKAVCQPQCKHGECIGPNKCKCHPGYAGKTCNQDEHSYPTPLDQGSEQPLFQPLDQQATSLPSRDLNECGLKPRPCKHRCMNTYGSYKCYCLNGYMLMPDGSCSSGLTCSMANCQYGCDVIKGQVRCQCPSPGLQLAPDGRTCVDVDECATGRVSCPRFRQCVNTFGSYICKCHKGFDLMYIGGKYQCHDIDECSLGQYQCSSFAHCFNVHGSYKCKCKDGYHGDGLSCVYIPKVMIEPSGPIHTPQGNGTISKGDGGHGNWIPDVGSTRWPLRTPHIPPVVTNRPTSKPTTRPTPKPTTWPATPPPPPPPTELRRPLPPPTQERPIIRLTTIAPAATTSPREITVDNRIQTDPQKPRGDVFKWSNWGQRQQWGQRFQRVQAVTAVPITPEEQGEVEKPSGAIGASSRRSHPLTVPSDQDQRQAPAESVSSGSGTDCGCERGHHRQQVQEVAAGPDGPSGAGGGGEALRDNQGQQPPLIPADGAKQSGQALAVNASGGSGASSGCEQGQCQQQVQVLDGTMMHGSKEFSVTTRGSPG